MSPAALSRSIQSTSSYRGSLGEAESGSSQCESRTGCLLLDLPNELLTLTMQHLLEQSPKAFDRFRKCHSRLNDTANQLAFRRIKLNSEASLQNFTDDLILKSDLPISKYSDAAHSVMRSVAARSGELNRIFLSGKSVLTITMDTDTLQADPARLEILGKSCGNLLGVRITRSGEFGQRQVDLDNLQYFPRVQAVNTRSSPKNSDCRSSSPRLLRSMRSFYDRISRTRIVDPSPPTNPCVFDSITCTPSHVDIDTRFGINEREECIPEHRMILHHAEAPGTPSSNVTFAIDFQAQPTSSTKAHFGKDCENRRLNWANYVNTQSVTDLEEYTGRHTLQLYTGRHSELIVGTPGADEAIQQVEELRLDSIPYLEDLRDRRITTTAAVANAMRKLSREH